jgi:hypothetical protein
MSATTRNGKTNSKVVEESDQSQLNPHDTRTANKCASALKALQTGRQSMADLRHKHGIMQPSGRINDLRNGRYLIDTVRVLAETPDGITHRKVAMYVLRAEVS